MFIKLDSGRPEIRPPFVSNKRGWTFNPYPTHRDLWQEKEIYIYYLISFFLLNLNLNFSPSVSFGFGHLYINEASRKKRKRRNRENEEREKNREKARFVSWVPFLPSHFLCIWSVFVRKRRGGKEGGRAVWGRLITSDL